MTAAALGLLVWAVLPVTSDADVRTVDALAARAALPRGSSEYLSADLTGDGVPDVVLVRRAPAVLTLFVVGGPVSRSATWWRLDVPAGECLVPARARLGLEDARAVLALTCGPGGHGDACDVLARWAASPGPPAREAAVRSDGLESGAAPTPRPDGPSATRPAGSGPEAGPAPADVRTRARAAVADIALLATPVGPVEALAAPAGVARSGEVAHPALRLSGGRCAPVHVFFDGESLRSWQAVTPPP